MDKTKTQQVIFVFFVLTIALVGFWKLRAAPTKASAAHSEPQIRQIVYRPVNPRLRQEAIAVVRGQLTAMQSGDYAKASDYDAVNAASKKVTRPAMAQQFYHFMSYSYPMLLVNQKASFGEALMDRFSNDIMLDTTVTDKSGHVFRVYYRMTPIKGQYRIIDIALKALS